MPTTNLELTTTIAELREAIQSEFDSFISDSDLDLLTAAVIEDAAIPDYDDLKEMLKALKPQSDNRLLFAKFKNIKSSAVLAARSLLNGTSFWALTDATKQRRFERFLTDASAAYGVTVPSVRISTNRDETTGTGVYRPESREIVLRQYSVVSLFSKFRDHLRHEGKAKAVASLPVQTDDSRAYALSMFYLAKPVEFRESVENGKLKFVTLDELDTYENR